MTAPADNFTPAQRRAIAAHGNLLVTAGAGTGKTQTLVARCLRLICEERSPVENLLLVTFTEAAAAEMRHRLRLALEARRRAQPDDAFLAEQIALLNDAHLGTLHSFCLRLVRRHFYELGLDPQVSVLDEQQTAPLLRATLDELLEARHGEAGVDGDAFRALARQLGRDTKLRALVLRLHRYAQSLESPADWLAAQTALFNNPEPAQWRTWFTEAVAELRANWLPALNELRQAAPAVEQCAAALEKLSSSPTTTESGAVLRAVIEADNNEDNWPRGSIGKVRTPLKEFFKDATFLADLAPAPDGRDPLADDWEWSRHQMLTLLRLAGDFTAAFSRAKRDLGGVDFADLEQFTLRLLRDHPAITEQWRGRFHHVFVDEYQDINAAQDAILRSVSRDGAKANRFLVGDVKQSIYRFRQANPKIFADYARRWDGADAEGAQESLADNFRSREGLLRFLNPLFGSLMSERVGGVAYEPIAFGAPEQRAAFAADGGARVEFHLISKESDATDDEASNGDGNGTAIEDLRATEREARLVARRLRQLRDERHQVWDKDRQAFRDAEWRDMVVLLRSRASRVESFAREFHLAGVPLHAERAGFFTSLEISDLICLLKLLDNPLQDVPLLAVLRSPLVALSLDELALIRAHNTERSWWLALQRFRLAGAGSDAPSAAVWDKVDSFLRSFDQWRARARQGALSDCLEGVLTETHYEALLLAGERGPERAANVRRLLGLVRRFDPYQRQGLYRFLQFIAAQEEDERDLETAPPQTGDAVRLMTIHQSKGLEFPVVVLAGTGTKFNEQDLREAILLTESHGLCPKVTPPAGERSYPSLAQWLGRRAERRELLGEELRLLYVALTRARDTLILTGTAGSKSAGQRWAAQTAEPLAEASVTRARCHLDWLLLWLPQITAEEHWRGDRSGENELLRWRLYAENDAAFGASISSDGTELEAPQIDDADAVAAVRERLAWTYAHATATALPAKTSVSALRRRLAEPADEEAVRNYDAATRRPKFRDDPRRGGKLTASEAGTAHHVFLQNVALDHVALDHAHDAASLRREAERMVQDGILGVEEAGVLDLAALAAFWRGEVGRAILAEPHGRVHRELPFTARFTPAELAAAGLPGLDACASDEFLVVQGVADLAVIRPEEIWLLDFKTDHFAAAELDAKVAEHAPQLCLYAAALERTYRRPVTKRWLHFLAVGQTRAL